MSEIRDPRPDSPRVLVVEDDPDTRRLLVTALSDGGYEPIPALDGRHALRTALAAGPSAIVLDLSLPEADGVEFAREYREHLRSAKTTPILVVSARHDADRVAEDIGARACIRKPFEIGHLVEQLARVIAGDGGRMNAAT